MTICDGCGASINSSETECPYCGHTLRKQLDAQKFTRDQGDIYSMKPDGCGGVDIEFGDGISGARPDTGKDNISAKYQSGAGRGGNLICSNCRHENLPIRDTCEACGASLKKEISRFRR